MTDIHENHRFGIGGWAIVGFAILYPSFRRTLVYGGLVLMIIGIVAGFMTFSTTLPDDSKWNLLLILLIWSGVIGWLAFIFGIVSIIVEWLGGLAYHGVKHLIFDEEIE